MADRDLVSKLFMLKWDKADEEMGLADGELDGIDVMLVSTDGDMAHFKLINIGVYGDRIKEWLEMTFPNVKIGKVSEIDLEFDLGYADLLSSFSIMEAAISVFKADPKTGKLKRVYKCIGGAKHGRKVSDPKLCDTNPDLKKRRTMRITQMKKRASMSLKRKLTKKHNVASKRARAANQRLKKIRGY